MINALNGGKYTDDGKLSLFAEFACLSANAFWWNRTQPPTWGSKLDFPQL